MSDATTFKPARTGGDLVRRGIIAAAYGFGLTRLLRSLPSRRDTLLILNYHAVARDPLYAFANRNVHPAVFERQARFLRDRYSVVSLDAALDMLHSDKPIPRDTVTLTFDHGYLDNYRYAFPILTRLGLPATFFVTAGPVVQGDRFWPGWLVMALKTWQRPDALAHALDLGGRKTWTQEALYESAVATLSRLPAAQRRERLQEAETVLEAAGMDPLPRSAVYMLGRQHLADMVSHGMQIGAQTLSHPDLGALGACDLSHEIAGARELLVEALNQSITHFAYPDTTYKFTAQFETIFDVLVQSGYQSGHTPVSSGVGKTDNRFALPRFGINEDLAFSEFAFRLERYRPRVGGAQGENVGRAV